MPTYERYKYCGQKVSDDPVKICGRVAEAECSGIHHPGIPHPDEIKGWANLPQELADHPKFVCPEHRVDE